MYPTFCYRIVHRTLGYNFTEKSIRISTSVLNSGMISCQISTNLLNKCAYLQGRLERHPKFQQICFHDFLLPSLKLLHVPC